MTALRIAAAAQRAMVAHARRDRPRECCGLLLGRGAHVRYAVPMPNVARGVSRYRVDPAGHLRLRRTLRAFAPALDIVGVYHSHPRGRAWPSPRDVAEAHYPEWWQVIVGLGRGRADVRAFRIQDGNIVRVRRRVS